MKNISTVNQIKMMAEETGKIYVRWSNSIALDSKRGYSMRYGTDIEVGLSACEINPAWENWRVVRQLTEYVFSGAKNCYIVTGDLVGLGGDGEPLLSNIKELGKVGKQLLAYDWRREQLESYIADDADRLTRITDPVGREIVENSKDRHEKLLIKHLAGEYIGIID